MDLDLDLPLVSRTGVRIRVDEFLGADELSAGLEEREFLAAYTHFVRACRKQFLGAVVGRGRRGSAVGIVRRCPSGRAGGPSVGGELASHDATQWV